jgi:glycosyltransferase involved in cell wall biosynthesis
MYLGINMKTISIITPCFNEEDNIQTCYNEIKNLFSTIDNYKYEHIFIDNASCDSTFDILQNIAKRDKNVKLILNSRNFGHIRSPYYGLLQSSGDASILFVADMQDPIEMIPKFIKEWERGYKSIVGVKKTSKESSIMFFIRKMYYKMVNKLSEIQLIDNFTGFGLYDKDVINILKSMKDPYPYFRGLIAEIGLSIKTIEYDQPVRIKGITKNNFYSLYDIGMLGIISHSKVPLRIATISGFILSFISLFISFIYFIIKILYWDTFDMGIAPIIVGMFFFFSIQLLFIGIIGEYIAFLYVKLQDRPLVIEKQRINFD